jgi:hypothetical protein
MKHLSYARVKFEGHVIAVSERPAPIYDSSVAIEIRFRSAKCLYIWKCGSKARLFRIDGSTHIRPVPAVRRSMPKVPVCR